MAHISEVKFRKVLKCFCEDIPATSTVKSSATNRNTVQRTFTLLRPSYFETRLLSFIKKLVSWTSCLELTSSNKMISANGESFQNVKKVEPLNYYRHKYDAPNMPEKRGVEFTT
jgi:hypothetical protein